MTAQKIGAKQTAKGLEKGELRQLLERLDKELDEKWLSSKTRAWLARRVR